LRDFKNPTLTGAFRGRAEIQNLFERTFAAFPGWTMAIKSESLIFPNPGVALESTLTAVVGEDGGDLGRARFANVFVEQADRCLLASVRESPFVVPDRSQELLRCCRCRVFGCAHFG